MLMLDHVRRKNETFVALCEDAVLRSEPSRDIFALFALPSIS
jgi:hypothetical protein